jgi:hypothetical protein
MEGATGGCNALGFAHQLAAVFPEFGWLENSGGCNQAGDKLYLMTVDETNGNTGIKPVDAAPSLIELGAWIARRLDSGGATLTGGRLTVALNGAGGQLGGRVTNLSRGVRVDWTVQAPAGSWAGGLRHESVDDAASRPVTAWITPVLTAASAALVTPFIPLAWPGSRVAAVAVSMAGLCPTTPRTMRSAGEPARASVWARCAATCCPTSACAALMRAS